jgi:hypothetical protein
MAHIFFERLEKRQSTQTLFSGIGGNTAIAIYAAPLPDSYGWGSIGYNPLTPQLLYGISPPTTNPTGGYFPWGGGGLFGMYGYSPYSSYSSWTNPFGGYSPWNSWGSGGFFSPIWNYLGGLFGGSFPWSGGGNYPGVPDIRLLYGIPSPIQSPTNITTFYGITTPAIPSLPPNNIVAYYGITVPSIGLY